MSLAEVPAKTEKTQTSQDEVAQEVELLILDYQVHQVIESILQPRQSTGAQLATTKQCATALWQWLSIYKQRADRPVADPDVRLRLQIAQFVILYCHRMQFSDHTPDVAELRFLREQNIERARTWIAARDRVPHDAYDVRGHFVENLPVDDAVLQHFRTLNSQRASLAEEVPFYGTSASISILDLLPQFMSICADFYAKIDTMPNAATFGLMINLIRQAYLEQYLAFGEDACDAIDGAFSWGCYKEVPEQMDGRAHSIDRMFRDLQSGEENAEWLSMRRAALDELLQPIEQAEPVQTRLKQLAALYPLQDFDEKLSEFVIELATALDPPVLVQLESGCLLGMSVDETTAFLQECGIDQRDWDLVEEWSPWLGPADEQDEHA